MLWQEESRTFQILFILGNEIYNEPDNEVVIQCWDVLKKPN